MFEQLIREQQDDESKAAVGAMFFETLVRSWEEMGIMNSESVYLNVESLRNVYVNGKLSVYSLLDYISRRV